MQLGASGRMCSYVRLVHHFRFFRFAARGRSQVHAGAHRCKDGEIPVHLGAPMGILVLYLAYTRSILTRGEYH